MAVPAIAGWKPALPIAGWKPALPFLLPSPFCQRRRQQVDERLEVDLVRVGADGFGDLVVGVSGAEYRLEAGAPSFAMSAGSCVTRPEAMDRTARMT